MNKYKKIVDFLLSPPPDYAVFKYTDRIKRLWLELKTLKTPLRSAFHLVRMCFLVGLSYVFLPVGFILHGLGYRFSNIDLAQLGSVIYLDLFIREDRMTRQTPKNKIFVLASHYTDGNRYILDLYNDHVTFVRNPFLKFLMAPFFMSPLFAVNSYKYDFTFHTETVAHKIWNSYQDKYKRPLIQFPKEDMAHAKALLKKHIPEGTKFVSLHVRDTGFYNIASQTSRNADIFSYKEAIRYLIGRGYAVIRLGDPEMVNMDALVNECGPLLFDYAHSDIKSEMMDCYLLSHCEFFIGLASGPSSVPMVFGVNSCNVNWYSAATIPLFLKDDIGAFKKFRYKKDNTLVLFDQLMLPHFARNPKNDDLLERGIDVEDNTPQEILDTVKEFIEHKGQTTDLQSKARSMVLNTNYAYGARGNFSNAILKGSLATFCSNAS
jgi:putative glycosyltransferase (TIGR04372 family)